MRTEWTPEDLPARHFYKLMTALILPRPIAWISTTSAEGVDNLAPHSFFTISCVDPPIVQFTSVGRKDSLVNVEATGEFVVNLAPESLQDLVNASGTPYPPEIGEFDELGIRREHSTLVRPPRVASSPSALECTLHSTLPLGDSTVVLGRVVNASVDRSVLVDGHPKVQRLQPLARLGRNERYTLGAVRAIDRIHYRPTEPGVPAPGPGTGARGRVMYRSDRSLSSGPVVVVRGFLGGRVGGFCAAVDGRLHGGLGDAVGAVEDPLTPLTEVVHVEVDGHVQIVVGVSAPGPADVAQTEPLAVGHDGVLIRITIAVLIAELTHHQRQTRVGEGLQIVHDHRLLLVDAVHVDGKHRVGVGVGGKDIGGVVTHDVLPVLTPVGGIHHQGVVETGLTQTVDRRLGVHRPVLIDLLVVAEGLVTDVDQDVVLLAFHRLLHT